MTNIKRKSKKHLSNEQLRALREKGRLSQTDVAEMLGVARSTYIRYETGVTMPPAYALLQISRILSISPSDLYDTFNHSNGYVPLADVPVYVREREEIY